MGGGWIDGGGEHGREAVICGNRFQSLLPEAYGDSQPFKGWVAWSKTTSFIIQWCPECT